MPRGDGTGPYGQGPITGGGGRQQGRGPIKNVGPDGYCVCPRCGEKADHIAATPCSSMVCPKCGVAMVRGSEEND